MTAALNAIPLPVFEAATVFIAGVTVASALYLVAVAARAIWGHR